MARKQQKKNRVFCAVRVDGCTRNNDTAMLEQCSQSDSCRNVTSMTSVE
jgi:hypothetical protein